MAKSPETYQYMQTSPNARPDIQLDVRPQDERSTTEKAARFSKKFNIVTGVAWGGAAAVGVAIANPAVISIGAIGLGTDVAAGVGSSAVEKRARRKRIEKQLEESSQGKYMSAETVRQQHISKRDLQPNQIISAKTVGELKQGAK